MRDMAAGMRPIQTPLAEVADISCGVTLLDNHGTVLGTGAPRRGADAVAIEIRTQGVASWLGLADGTPLVAITPRHAALGDIWHQPLKVTIS